MVEKKEVNKQAMLIYYDQDVAILQLLTNRHSTVYYKHSSTLWSKTAKIKRERKEAEYDAIRCYVNWSNDIEMSQKVLHVPWHLQIVKRNAYSFIQFDHVNRCSAPDKYYSENRNDLNIYRTSFWQHLGAMKSFLFVLFVIGWRKLLSYKLKVLRIHYSILPLKIVWNLDKWFWAQVTRMRDLFFSPWLEKTS